MFLQLDDYTGTLENITSQNRRTFANNNPYRFYDKTGNNAEEVRTTAQTNQNQSGYDIDYVQPVFTAQEEPEGTGDPISAYSGDVALDGNDTKRVAIAFVMGYIMLGIWKFRDVLNAIVEGRIEIVCPIGYQLTLNTYELQQTNDKIIFQSNTAIDSGSLDNSSSNKNYKELDKMLKNLRDKCMGAATRLGFYRTLAALLTNLKSQYLNNWISNDAKQKHHVVPLNDGYDLPRQILDHAKIERKKSYIGSPNIAYIYTYVHHSLHSKGIKDIYYFELLEAFQPYQSILRYSVVPLNKKNEILWTLTSIKNFLELISETSHNSLSARF